MGTDSPLILLDDAFRLAAEALLPVRAPAEWRPLADQEVREMQARGCLSPDWSRVLVSARTDLRTLGGCRFEGDVRIDAPAGSRIISSTIRDCEICGPAIVDDVGLLQGYRLLEGSEVSHCGSVRFGRGSCPGTGMVLNLGCETGERALRGMPTLSVDLAAALTSNRPSTGDLPEYDRRLDGLLSGLASGDLGLIGRNACIRCTQLVEDTMLCDECSIEAACSVRGCCLLGGQGEGSSISSALQWGSIVRSLASVSRSVVGEMAVVERSARLTGSLLGPGCVSASGEITASLVGPQVAAHHSSLLIAARWPRGCGNLGYGANVGSNHTSRLPDQEISVGCGVFFGLGCSIKFPCSLEGAPGTIVATGVTLPSQKLEYPFSLVTERTRHVEGCPDGLLELRPAWVLYGNLFSLLRNSRKYAARHTAKRSLPPGGLSDPDTLDFVLEARRRLLAVKAREGGFYRSGDLEGAGECFVTEESRRKAIEGYDLFVAWQVSGRFAAQLASGHGQSALPEEFRGLQKQEMLALYEETLVKMAALAGDSRARDYERGTSVIEDYAAVHVRPEQDTELRDVLAPLLAELEKVRRLRTRIPDPG
jgi:hypothetical protein